MGLINAFTGALSGSLADQWKDIITADSFGERTALSPGVYIGKNMGRGSNTNGSFGVITHGSKIYVPENTAAVIFSENGIEDIVTVPGGYIYQNGERTVFEEGIGAGVIMGQLKERFKYGGQPGGQKTISFINLREIRGIKFGTSGPMMYNDIFYGTDLSVTAFGNISIMIVNPQVFIKNFVPANMVFYSFDGKNVRDVLVSEFLQSFMAAVNSLSSKYRISQLPSHLDDLTESLLSANNAVNSWEERFGFKLVHIGIQNIEYSDESKELVRQYSANKMNVMAYDNASQRSADISAKQKVAQGIEKHGLGKGGAGIFLGMNATQGMMNQSTPTNTMSFDQQIDAVKKLKELLDCGILTQEEFNIKKKEIMGL